MTASTPSLSFAMKSFAQDQCGGFEMKILSNNERGVDQVTASRRLIASLLWCAFPGPSEHDVANKAARALGVSPRQARNWLRGEHSCAGHYVFAILTIAGVELVLGDEAAKEPRNTSDHRGRACGERSNVRGGTFAGGLRRSAPHGRGIDSAR